MPSDNTNQRKLAANMITDMAGCCTLRIWVLPHSTDLLPGKFWL